VSSFVPRPIVPLDLPVKVQSWELIVCSCGLRKSFGGCAKGSRWRGRPGNEPSGSGLAPSCSPALVCKHPRCAAEMRQFLFAFLGEQRCRSQSRASVTETQSLKDTGRQSIPLRKCRTCALNHAYCSRKIYGRERTVCEDYHHSLTRAVRNGPRSKPLCGLRDYSS
jgi:hypothetical protein